MESIIMTLQFLEYFMKNLFESKTGKQETLHINKTEWPDLGPFPVEDPQTLVLCESRLFLIGPGASLETSRFSSKDDTRESLLSSRSVNCQHRQIENS